MEGIYSRCWSMQDTQPIYHLHSHIELGNTNSPVRQHIEACPAHRPAQSLLHTHTPQLACIIIQYFIPVAGASYLAQFALHWGRNQQVITACSFPMHACVLFTFLGHQQVWSYYIVSFIILYTHTRTHSTRAFFLNKFITNRFRHFKTKRE